MQKSIVICPYMPDYTITTTAGNFLSIDLPSGHSWVAFSFLHRHIEDELNTRQVIEDQHLSTRFISWACSGQLATKWQREVDVLENNVSSIMNRYYNWTALRNQLYGGPVYTVVEIGFQTPLTFSRMSNVSNVLFSFVLFFPNQELGLGFLLLQTDRKLMGPERNSSPKMQLS